MNAKKLIILVCVAAALVIVAVLTSDKSGSQKEGVSNRLLFKDLPVNDITRIEIVGASSAMKLVRKDDTWVAADKYSYPAKFDRIKDVLMMLSELEAGDERNLNDKQRARVKMISPLNKDAEDSAKGTLARVYTSADKPVASLLIGGNRSTESATPGAGASGTFVSPDEGKTILLTSAFVGYLESTDPASWLNTEIMSVNSFSITNITVSPYDADPFVLSGGETGELTLDKVPWRRKLDTDKARTLRYSLSYLRFAEVADPSLSDEEMGFDKPATFKAVTTDNVIYTVTIGGKVPGRDDRYLRARAEYIGEAPSTPENSEEPMTAEAKKIEETIEKVKTLNNRLAGWTYVVLGQDVASMLFTRDDLVTKKDD